ncbi:MAG: hypothetical protein PHW63_04665 [Alphaproteobacteria bacterium]|nr:hypothetical protein [Alphaproteobacteria bacterium]
MNEKTHDLYNVNREDPALDAGDVAIQSPIFKQEDWIASSAKASSQL